MYSTEKQIEIANIAFTTLVWYQKDYQEVANNLLSKLSEEKKTKLSNYIKILCLSSSVKTYNKKYKSIDFNIDTQRDELTYEQTMDMCSLYVALLLTLEMSVTKSKELKTDLRLKLIEELLNEVETNNKDLAKICHREVTKIIKR